MILLFYKIMYVMYEWNLMVINVLLIQSEGHSFEEYQFSDIFCNAASRCYLDIILSFYVGLYEFDSSNFYVYMYYGVLFGGPQLIINYSWLISIIELCN